MNILGIYKNIGKIKRKEKNLPDNEPKTVYKLYANGSELYGNGYNYDKHIWSSTEYSCTNILVDDKKVFRDFLWAT